MKTENISTTLNTTSKTHKILAKTRVEQVKQLGIELSKQVVNNFKQNQKVIEIEKEYNTTINEYNQTLNELEKLKKMKEEILIKEQIQKEELEKQEREKAAKERQKQEKKKNFEKFMKSKGNQALIEQKRELQVKETTDKYHQEFKKFAKMEELKLAKKNIEKYKKLKQEAEEEPLDYIPEQKINQLYHPMGNKIDYSTTKFHNIMVIKHHIKDKIDIDEEYEEEEPKIPIIKQQKTTNIKDFGEKLDPIRKNLVEKEIQNKNNNITTYSELKKLKNKENMQKLQQEIRRIKSNTKAVEEKVKSKSKPKYPAYVLKKKQNEGVKIETPIEIPIEIEEDPEVYLNKMLQDHNDNYDNKKFTKQEIQTQAHQNPKQETHQRNETNIFQQNLMSNYHKSYKNKNDSQFSNINNNNYSYLQYDKIANQVIENSYLENDRLINATPSDINKINHNYQNFSQLDELYSDLMSEIKDIKGVNKSEIDKLSKEEVKNKIDIQPSEDTKIEKNEKKDEKWKYSKQELYNRKKELLKSKKF